MILEVDDNALHFIKQCFFFFISNKNFIGKKKKKTTHFIKHCYVVFTLVSIYGNLQML